MKKKTMLQSKKIKSNEQREVPKFSACWPEIYRSMLLYGLPYKIFIVASVSQF